MAINFTADDVRHGYLVLATADQQIDLTGLGGYSIPAGYELCLFWYRDSTAGSQGSRGLAGTTMLITAYYIQNQTSNDQTLQQNCTPSTEGNYPVVRFPSKTRKVFDVDAVMNWHNKAVSSLLHYACEAAGLDTMAKNPMPKKKIYKGSRWAGHQETPESYLAMAFKQGILGAKVKSGRHNEWTARKVYEYALKVAGLP